MWQCGNMTMCQCDVCVNVRDDMKIWAGRIKLTTWQPDNVTNMKDAVMSSLTWRRANIVMQVRQEMKFSFWSSCFWRSCRAFVKLLVKKGHLITTSCSRKFTRRSHLFVELSLSADTVSDCRVPVFENRLSILKRNVYKGVHSHAQH